MTLNDSLLIDHLVTPPSPPLLLCPFHSPLLQLKLFLIVVFIMSLYHLRGEPIHFWKGAHVGKDGYFSLAGNTPKKVRVLVITDRVTAGDGSTIESLKKATVDVSSTAPGHKHGRVVPAGNRVAAALEDNVARSTTSSRNSCSSSLGLAWTLATGPNLRPTSNPAFLILKDSICCSCC